MKVVIASFIIIILFLGFGIYFLFFYNSEIKSENNCINNIEERLSFEKKVTLAPKDFKIKINEFKEFNSKEEALIFIEEENSFEENYGYPKAIKELKINNFKDNISVAIISSTFATEIDPKVCSFANLTTEECSKWQEIQNKVYIFPVVCAGNNLLNSSLEDIKWFAGRTFEYDPETNERVFNLFGEEIRKGFNE